MGSRIVQFEVQMIHIVSLPQRMIYSGSNSIRTNYEGYNFYTHLFNGETGSLNILFIFFAIGAQKKIYGQTFQLRS